MTTLPTPRSRFLIPVSRRFSGAQTSYLFNEFQDLGLVAAGILGVVPLARSKGRAARSGPFL